MNITEIGKSICTGCSLCSAVCPKSAIAMSADEEGFLYPKCNTALCINCGICLKECPSRKDIPKKEGQRFYEAKAKDDALRKSSTSGGIFGLLAQKVLEEHGCVYGAGFEDGSWFISNIDTFLQVPVESVSSVKITFGLVFLGFFVNLISSIFSVATYVTNKMYLSSIRTIEANALRLLTLIICFMLFGPNITFVALSMLVYQVFVAFTNYRYTKKLIPEIQIRRSSFNIHKIRELVVSGCWSSITSLSNVLLEGLDLVICNLLIGASAMGTVSIVKTVPSMIYQCLYSVLSVFNPQLTICYAKGDIKGIVSYMEFSCKVVALLMALRLVEHRKNSSLIRRITPRFIFCGAVV